MLWVEVWDFKGGGRQLTQRWKSKLLVKICLLGHEGSVGHRVDSGLLRISPDTYPVLFVGPLF